MGRADRDWQQDKDDDIAGRLRDGGLTEHEDEQCRHPDCNSSPYLGGVFCYEHGPYGGASPVGETT